MIRSLPGLGSGETGSTSGISSLLKAKNHGPWHRSPVFFEDLRAQAHGHLLRKLISPCLWIAACKREQATFRACGTKFHLDEGRGVFLHLESLGSCDLEISSEGNAQVIAATIDLRCLGGLRPHGDCGFNGLCQTLLAQRQHKPIEFAASDRILRVLEDCLRFSGDDPEARLFREIKSTELLVHLCRRLRDQQRTNEVVSLGLLCRDISRLNEARSILDHRLQDAPTLRELARMVGTNEKKLNRGFRLLFQTTVHGYLAKQRLKRAYHLIKDRRENISVAASEVGYTPSHLSYAFRKAYGISPSDLRSNKQARGDDGPSSARARDH